MTAKSSARSSCGAANMPVERPAGSHSLAAAAHRRRSAFAGNHCQGF
jgi:hypothetical protein